MKLKLGLLLIAIIVLVTICFLVWPTLFRYSSLKINSQTILVRINRISGYTQHLYPSGWINIDAHLTSVPQSDIVKIEIITSNLNRKKDTQDALEATIYNGSNWIINNITYKIEYRDKYEILKNVKISRKYKIDGLYIPPLNLVSVPLYIIDADKLSSTSFVPVKDNNGNLKPYNKNIWKDERRVRVLSHQEVFEIFTGYEVVEIAKPNYSIIPLEAKGYKIR